MQKPWPELWLFPLSPVVLLWAVLISYITAQEGCDPMVASQVWATDAEHCPYFMLRSLLLYTTMWRNT